MKTMIANTVGRVASTLPTLGAAPWAFAPAMTAAASPPPNLVLSAVKFFTKSALLPISSTTNARNVPTEAMIQNTFCQRNVVRTPAMWITVMRAIIANPPMKIQSWSFWKLVPQLVRESFPKMTPRTTSTGPRAKTGK